jgi:putative chitinase
MSAAWFFQKNNLWTICDRGSSDEVVAAVTKRVNGAHIGLPDRLKHFKEFWHLLQ